VCAKCRCIEFIPEDRVVVTPADKPVALSASERVALMQLVKKEMNHTSSPQFFATILEKLKG
jgi:hypothetical protein